MLVVNNAPMRGAHSALESLEDNKDILWPHVHFEDNPYVKTMLDDARAIHRMGVERGDPARKSQALA